MIDLCELPLRDLLLSSIFFLMQHFIFFFSVLLISNSAFGQSDYHRPVVPGLLTINTEPGIEQLTVRYRKQNEGKTIPGYRVQIFSGKKQAALDLKAEVLRAMPQIECNVVYEVPDYKVQIGNYRSKIEAEKALSEIWPVYKSAFYVQTQINLPRLPIEE